MDAPEWFRGAMVYGSSTVSVTGGRVGTCGRVLFREVSGRSALYALGEGGGSGILKAVATGIDSVPALVSCGMSNATDEDGHAGTLLDAGPLQWDQTLALLIND